MAHKDVLVVGSHGIGVYIHCRQLPRPGESVAGWDFDPMAADDGGKGTNQAFCAARLGASTTLFCAIGEADAGWASLQPLAATGVDLTQVVRIAGTRTGAGVVIIDADGTSVIVTDPGANAAITGDHIAGLDELMQRHRCMLTQFELDADIALQAAHAAARAGARAFVTPGPLPELKSGMLRDIDIITPNETEAAVLLGVDGIGNDHEGAARGLRERWGVRNVVLTRGAAGVTALWDGEICTVDAFPVDARNTVGAGDGFCAALATAVARDVGIEQALVFASAVAALAVQVDAGPWTSYPGRAQVAAFMAQKGCGAVCERVFAAG